MAHELIPFEVRAAGLRDRVAKIVPQRVVRLLGVADADLLAQEVAPEAREHV
jgi:hypothetical protein